MFIYFIYTSHTLIHTYIYYTHTDFRIYTSYTLHNMLHNKLISVSSWLDGSLEVSNLLRAPGHGSAPGLSGLSGAMGGHGSRSEASKVDFKTLRPSKLFFFQHQSVFFWVDGSAFSVRRSQHHLQRISTFHPKWKAQMSRIQRFTQKQKRDGNFTSTISYTIHQCSYFTSMNHTNW